jgi:hypothetical protein
VEEALLELAGGGPAARIEFTTAYLFVFSAAQHSRLVFYVACYWAGFATHSGLSGFHRATFYFLCAVCGYGLWQLAEAVALGCARASLLDNCQIYENALAKGRLRVIRLDSMQQPVLTPDDITAASSGFVPLKRFPVLLVLTNIVMEALTYLLGFFTGLAATAIDHLRGIAGLRPERADLIMRQLKKGTVGLLALGLGYVGIYSIWGLLAVLLYVLAVVLLALKQRRVPVAGS